MVNTKRLMYLRNRHKVSDVYGDDILKMIEGSINKFNESGEPVESERIGNDKFKTFIIKDVWNTTAFYIVDSSFNIYKLAFKEFIV